MSELSEGMPASEDAQSCVDDANEPDPVHVAETAHVAPSDHVAESTHGAEPGRGVMIPKTDIRAFLRPTQRT